MMSMEPIMTLSLRDFQFSYPLNFNTISVGQWKFYDDGIMTIHQISFKYSDASKISSYPNLVSVTLVDIDLRKFTKAI